MNTYSDIYLHIVFAVKYRINTFDKSWFEHLHAYIASIFKANGHHPIIIGGVADHVHCLIGYNTKQSIPDMMREVKASSSTWINSNPNMLYKFAWQKGYGVFSYSKSHIDDVKKYIANQESHHTKNNFRDEFQQMLKARGISYDAHYLPEEPE